MILKETGFDVPPKHPAIIKNTSIQERKTALFKQYRDAEKSNLSHADLKITILHFNTALSTLKKEMKANTHEHMCCEIVLLLSFVLCSYAFSIASAKEMNVNRCINSQEVEREIYTTLLEYYMNFG